MSRQNRKPFLPLILTIVAVFGFGRIVSAGADDILPRETAVIHGDGTTGPYTLVSRFIDGSVHVDSPDVSQYTVTSSDALHNTILIQPAIPAGDSVIVRFTPVPSWLRERYTRDDRDSSFGLRPSTSYKNARDKTPKSFPGLRFGGSKTFDINVGSDREAALNQTLRLAISGNLTEDITLNAVVSDQNVPITPEGDTRELSELDRVLIELRGKRFSVDMGDTDLRSDTGRWLSWSRRLSGASGRVKAGDIEVFASGAVSEGRHMSVTIAPIEGNRGPYRLQAEDGRTDIAIVPGTEKVWLNGARLTRGLNDDYIIDYATGELTFTENRIIGSDMRIVCDYEYTSESFRRTFFTGGAEGSFLDDRLSFTVAAAKEADDPDRAVLFDLDDAMRSSLKQAGDAPATFTGIREAVSDTTGTYDLLDGHLVFNPTRDGEYNATFSWMGDDKGTYRYRGGGVYEFVPEAERGPGSGASYDPVIILPGPVSHSVAGGTVSFDPLPYLHLEGEAASSSVDLNTLSSRDDDDNSGRAYDVGASLTPVIDAAVPLKVTLSGERRDRGKRFQPLDRDRTAEENRRWGFPLVMEAAREIVSEYAGGVAVDGGSYTGSGVSASGGRFELDGSARSSRADVTGVIRREKRYDGTVTAARIERDGLPGVPDERIDRIDGMGRFQAAGFTPRVSWESERRTGMNDDGHGVEYGEVRTGLVTPSLLGLTGEMEWLYRSERTRRQAWKDSSTVRGGSVELTSKNAGNGMFRARYARRERLGGGLSSATDQGLLEGSYRAGTGFSFDLSYRAGRARETVKRKNYIYAGMGRGSYRWEDMNGDGVRDPEEFIPDEHGEYYLYEETLDMYRPVNTVGTYGRIGVLLPSVMLERIGLENMPVTTETSFEINERSTADASDVFLLKLSRFRKSGVTTSGDFRFQEDVTVPVAGEGSIRFRFFRFSSYEGEYVTGAEKRDEGEESVRLRLPFSDEWDMETTLRHGGAKRMMEQRSLSDFDVGSWSGDAEISHYPRSSVKMGATVGGGRDKDDLSRVTVNYTVLKPSATYFFSGRGRIEASYVRTAVSAGNLAPGRTLPYTMARGRKDGVNHDISVTCDYRLSHRMNIVATYTGRKFADRKFEHFARTQLRAMF